jgi:hypothetical protein
MDVNDPSSSPSGAQFIPQLPPLGTEPIQPFSDSLELEFELYVRNGPNRKVLSPRHLKCSSRSNSRQPIDPVVSSLQCWIA